MTPLLNLDLFKDNDTITNDGIDIIILKQKDIKPLRDYILAEINNICPICQKEIKENKAILEHSHQKIVKGTGQIRGVTCSGCNIMLGKVENNCIRYGISQAELPNVLRGMAEWLEKPHLPYLHPTEVPKEPKLTKVSYNKLKKLFKEKYPKGKMTPYPKSGKVIKKLQELFVEFNLEPEYYAN